MEERLEVRMKANQVNDLVCEMISKLPGQGILKSPPFLCMLTDQGDLENV